ncbi:MAG TPA: anti-sigma-V factor rsiV [Bacillales bacterium]|nr:anti-sigma-V factor rsiV [Bacillales bacterium]
MDKKIEKLKTDYHNIPIPNELDFVVKKALQQKPRKTRKIKWIAGVAAALVVFVGGLNVNETFAKTMAEVPVIGNIVKVLTFVEYKVDEETYNADIKAPAIHNLKNEGLQATLNEKYLEESKALYEQFQADIDELKAANGGHLGVDSGYEIKTDNDRILSIGRYVVNTVASSSTTYQFDTIDKQKGLLITLPSLFKNDAYINVISEEVKKQMIAQMENDDSMFYWVENPNHPVEDLDLIDPFEKIKANQSFYINKDNKLVIVFDKYEVAPGYMGVVEFTIPSVVLEDILVSHEYIK